LTVALKNRPPVVVPASALRRAGFKRGQILEVKTASGVIVIVSKVAHESASADRGLSRGINQSLKEYRQGKFAGPFVTAQEFLADLHRETAKLDAKQRNRRRQ